MIAKEILEHLPSLPVPTCRCHIAGGDYAWLDNFPEKLGCREVRPSCLRPCLTALSTGKINNSLWMPLIAQA